MPLGASGMSHNSSRMHSSIYGSAIAAKPAATSRPVSRGGQSSAGGGAAPFRSVTSGRSGAEDRIRQHGLATNLREGASAISAFAGAAAGRPNPRTALDLGSQLGGQVPPASWQPAASAAAAAGAAAANPAPPPAEGPFNPLEKQSYLSFTVTNVTEYGEADAAPPPPPQARPAEAAPTKAEAAGGGALGGGGAPAPPQLPARSAAAMAAAAAARPGRCPRGCTSFRRRRSRGRRSGPSSAAAGPERRLLLAVGPEGGWEEPHEVSL